MNEQYSTDQLNSLQDLDEQLNPLVTSPPAGREGPVDLYDRSGESGWWTVQLNDLAEENPVYLSELDRREASHEIRFEREVQPGVSQLKISDELTGILPEQLGQSDDQTMFWKVIDHALQRYESDFVISLPERGTLDLTGRPALMGVLNVTPDSFSDGGEYNNLSKAVDRAEKLEEEGASIVDVGGESTRPGADPVSVKEEIKRTIPVIDELSDRLTIPISIDTQKPEVARKAIEAGAEMLNDVGGLQREPELIELADEHNVPVVAMHMQGTPDTMQENPQYDHVLRDVGAFLRNAKYCACDRGLSSSQVVLDPGIGFGKTLQHNLKLVEQVHQLRSLGCPVLLGTSRKSFIGEVLEVPVDQRVEGTAASVAGPALMGIDLFRVHDVNEIYRFLKMVWSIHADSDWRERLIQSEV